MPAVVHCKVQSADVYVGRPGPWGNPFWLGDERLRLEVIDRFRAWGEAQPWFVDAARRELSGLTLGCWCAPRACHGDVLASWANGESSSSPRWIMVFGSNLAGRHGKGAARDAARLFGAEPGAGSGPTGSAWAIPTKDENLRMLPLERIAESVAELKADAAGRPEDRFLVTRIGCGLARYRDEDIAPLFADSPGNLVLPGRWTRILDPAAIPRVAVCGSREFADEAFLWRCLDRLRDRFGGPFEVVSGGARGADSLGEDYAVRRELPLTRFPALWRSLGKPAGKARNLSLLWRATHVVAFWDGRSPGTRAMLDQAKAEGVPVWLPRQEA